LDLLKEARHARYSSTCEADECVMTTPDEGIVSIGDELRRRREALGKSRERLSVRLRISAEYLEALETDQFDLLPGYGYAKGFLRTYSDYLGADTERLLQLYEERPTHTTEALLERTSKKTWLPSNIVRWAVIVLALLVLWFFYTHVTG
jgi:cytoskeletal protein RodZ